MDGGDGHLGGLVGGIALQRRRDDLPGPLLAFGLGGFFHLPDFLGQLSRELFLDHLQQHVLGLGLLQLGDLLEVGDLPFLDLGDLGLELVDLRPLGVDLAGLLVELLLLAVERLLARGQAGLGLGQPGPVLLVLVLGGGLGLEHLVLRLQLKLLALGFGFGDQLLGVGVSLLMLLPCGPGKIQITKKDSRTAGDQADQECAHRFVD